MPSIRIRRYVSHDVQRLYEAARESIPEVYPWLPWCHPEYTMADAQRWVDLRDEAWSGGASYEFVIESESGRFLGGCGLNQISTANQWANLGYWVRTSAAGQGVATQAVRLLEDWAFRKTELDRLEIVAAELNRASIRVAEKSGAVREGIARERLLLHEKRHDAVVFSLLRSDWVRR